MIIRDYSTPNIRGISDFRGEITQHESHESHELSTTKFMVNS